ncbi:hypothetical protein BH09MYX1_BH09MYX1_40040 [soil metagenome]
MSDKKKPDVNATIQLDQIENIDDIVLPESRPRMAGAADDSGSMRPRQLTLPPPLPPEEAAKAYSPRTSQAPVSASVRPSGPPTKAKSGPPVALIVVFVVLLAVAVVGGLRFAGVIGGGAASASGAAKPPPSASAVPTATADPPPSGSTPAPMRTITIPEIN